MKKLSFQPAHLTYFNTPSKKLRSMNCISSTSASNPMPPSTDLDTNQLLLQLQCQSHFDALKLIIIIIIVIIIIKWFNWSVFYWSIEDYFKASSNFKEIYSIWEEKASAPCYNIVTDKKNTSSKNTSLTLHGGRKAAYSIIGFANSVPVTTGKILQTGKRRGK